jgi:hypothetical protein
MPSSLLQQHPEKITWQRHVSPLLPLKRQVMIGLIAPSGDRHNGAAFSHSRAFVMDGNLLPIGAIQSILGHETQKAARPPWQHR